MCAIEKMEDLVRCYSSRRDAQRNAHNLAEDIRMSSLEALLPYDLEKHVQLNRARFDFVWCFERRNQNILRM